MKARLGIVLEIRQAAESAAKREVGKLERERAELTTRRAARLRELEGAGAAQVVPALREQLAAYIGSLRRALVEDAARIAAHDKLIDAARGVLAQAHRDVKAIEAIRARDAAAAAKRMERHEARANDEHAARIRMEAMA